MTVHFELGGDDLGGFLGQSGSFSPDKVVWKPTRQVLLFVRDVGGMFGVDYEVYHHALLLFECDGSLM